MNRLYQWMSRRASFDNCPLFGQQLAPTQAEQARLRLQQGSTSKEDLPGDGTSP
jgi:hypothetical protein